MSEVFIFVDNSNIWIEGKRISGSMKSPPVDMNYYYRIEYGCLLTHVCEGRNLGAMPQLYGSEPPPNDSVWKMIRSKGYDVNVFKRNFFGKEKGVDMRMGMDVAKLIFRQKPRKDDTIIIIAGDADFLPVIEDSQAEGWTVEVWYWSNCAGDLKKKANRYEELNPAIYKIGFDETT